MNRFLLPLGIFVALVALLGAGLKLNPRLVPSPLIGKSVPEFSLPRLADQGTTLSQSDLIGKVTLINVWATWCVGCREEHPLLVRLAEEGQVPIYGLNYKDDRAEALRWLARYGNPYVASAYDADGTVGIDLGVYGLPETFVVGPDGVIAYKHIGPVTAEVWRDKMRPVLESLRQSSG